MSGSMSGMWKRSYGEVTRAPPDERGGNRQTEPTATAPHLDSTEEFGVALHSHVAESKVQAITGYRRYGKSLVAHLDDLGLLGPRFTAAHSIWLDDTDLKRFADQGASVPITWAAT